jgi:membrane protein insertase Oxa1/YidC/SpoIIIJ
MWHSLVDLIRAAIFSAAQICGGSLGGGILAVSFVVRLGLLPLTLRMARRARDQQRRRLLIQGEIEGLSARHAKDPARLFRETEALLKRNGIRALHPPTLLGALVQAPLLAGLYSAVRAGLGQRVRFAWIADLGRANETTALLVAALTAAAAAIAPVPSTHAGGSYVPAIVAALVTLAFLWSASSAVALSWGSGAAVSILQNVILVREDRRARMGGSKQG